nr:lysozyme inhibitor LprI family protein [uncultured Rhodopila sp.]
MRKLPAYGALLACLAAGVPAARAAGIDCGKARSPAEKAICASPELLALDRQVAAAYADALARRPQQKDAMRQDLIRWLKQRDTACALPAADIAPCLTSQLTARLADLAPVATPPPATPPGATAPGGAPPAEALRTAAPAAPPADPPIPPNVTPQGAATLDQTQLAAAEHAETMLRVTSAGRFAIAAKSASGAAIQLIDILTGPGGIAGIAGAQDGRLDALLDVGVYKLRVTSERAAAGAVFLGVTPFHDAAPPAALPQPGFPLAAALRDGEQRAFWLTVPPDGSVRIEAAGRALGDLRLWRDGRELTALEPAAMRVEPVSGHPLTDLRLEGKVEPGTYLAVAYGGPPLAWTDNDPDQTFLLRCGASPALAEGRAGGPMGPFGSEVFDLPAATGLVRLSLPASAAAELRAGDSVATLSRGSREPTVHLAVRPGKTPTVELRAAAGQPFTLQALEQPAATVINRPGTYWVSAVVNGAGGDEVPAGVLLQRSESADKPPRIVAGSVPRVGPGAAWHARFNLRGPTTLLVENTAAGELAVRSSGVSVTQRGQPGVYDLAADYYGLNLTPVDGALGSLDLVAGPPGAAAPPVAAWPPDPVVPFGVQTLGPGQSLQVLGPSAPGVQLGLSARRVPVALAEGPLTVTQAVGSTLAIPVTLAAGGTLAVSEIGGGPIGFGLQETSGGASNVVLPLADHPRTIVLAWRRSISPIPIAAPLPPGTGVALQPGRPASLDLMRDESRGFALTLPQGGLYRVETLGRLRTAGRIATAFIPRLQDAEANGVGQNMLIQQVLRAGAYRVDVTALESAGHLAVSVTPAPVLFGAALSPGGSVRASLPAGSAISFPLAIAEPNRRYRLDVPALGTPWQGRIEDAQGWPMTVAGPLDGITPALPPGDYRLVVSPASADRQVVARLTEMAAAPEITGHGPHRLPFEAPQTAVWREPEARDQPRTPDAWSFDLAGPAGVALDLGDGMTGELHRAGETASIARITGHYAGKLEAGQYRLDAASLGRNDRLAYTIALTSPALQPGVPRTVALPSTTGFAIAEARVVSLTSFGNTPVKAVLRRDDGSVVARIGARADDWNIAASRLLPAGRYRLDLAAASPPGLSAVSRSTPAATDQDASDKGGEENESEPEAGQPPAPPDNDQSDAAKPADDAPAAGSPSTELRLALPEALPAVAAPARTTELTGAGVHVLTLDQPAPGKLLVAQAASGASLVLALERRTAGGWQVVALDESTAPIVASPADADQAPWRVEVWTVDGGAQSIRVAARGLDVAPQPAGSVALAALEDMPAAVAVAHVALDSAAPVSIEAAPGLLAGGWAGQPLAPLNGPVLPQARDVWLLGHEAGTATVAALPLSGVQAMIVPPGQVAQLGAVTPPAGPAAAPPAGHVAIWRAEGGFAQPGLGAAAGIATFSAVALADRPVVLRNASGDGPLRVTLTRLDLELLPARTLDAALQTTLPPGSALPLRLPGGDKVLQADMGAEVAAFAGQAAVWAGAAPVSRSLPGGCTDILLVNAGRAAAPASLAWQPAPPAAPLRAGSVLKRFFGAGGSFELPFDAAAGARLVSAGDASLTAIAADGAVRRGQDIVLSGTGRVVVEHGTGPIAVWLAADGVSPWPDAAVQQVRPPARLALAGAAMALGLNQDSPSLLHVSTTAPVLAALVQAGRTDPPRLFPAGAELHVMLAAGAAELRLYPPSDGPLTGSLMLSAEPVTPIGEGLGAPVSVAPGRSAVFAFSLAKAATIGVGVRADPDRASVRLLDASGAVLGEGVAQLRALRAGQYLIEARVPPDSAPAILRPAVIGITPRGSGPPPDVAQKYLELVGLKPAQGTTP